MLASEPRATVARYDRASGRIVVEPTNGCVFAFPARRAQASFGGVERRLLVDSGATLTTISTATAQAAGVDPRDELLPVILRTANGDVRAQTAQIDELRLGNIVARALPVVVSPAFGRVDVLGMNFLSRLKSWRVEGKTLILVPHHPQAVSAA
jgi:aspartyl protease family protein